MVFVVKCPVCQKPKRIPEDRSGFRCCHVEFEIKEHQIGKSIKRSFIKKDEPEIEISFEEKCIECGKPVSENCNC